MAIDFARYQTIRTAPQAVFDQLAQPGMAERPRFMHRVRGDWSAVSWGRFGQMIRAVALGLNARGLQAGQCVAIYAQNCVEWAATALGIQAAGGVMVPVYPSVPLDGLRDVLQRSDAQFVFGDAGSWQTLYAATRETGCTPVGWDRPEFSALVQAGQTTHVRTPKRFEALLSQIDLHGPALMLFTSGTSGRPKGVPLTHHAVGANARDWLQCFAPAVTEGDIDLLWLPMSHIFGFGEMCLGNTLGWTSWLSTPKALMDDLPTVRPHVLMSVPSVWEKLGHAAEAGTLQAASGGRLRFCLSGGAGLKVAIKERLAAHGLTVFEGYGLTEASPTLTLNRPGAVRFDSVGKPLPSVSIRLAEDGEILARGPNVFAGYHGDPEATAQAFTADGWLKTGDIGRFTDDGFLQIVDRKKDILVTRGGKNIAPANIERRFADDALVAHAVVYGDGHKYLVAGIWPAVAGVRRTELEDSVQRVNAELMRVETIKKFVVMDTPLTVESGLLTPTQKVKRKAVYRAFQADFEALYRPGE
jgi:long-chain acyl-CoA synthetase